MYLPDFVAGRASGGALLLFPVDGEDEVDNCRSGEPEDSERFLFEGVLMQVE